MVHKSCIICTLLHQKTARHPACQVPCRMHSLSRERLFGERSVEVTSRRGWHILLFVHAHLPNAACRPFPNRQSHCRDPIPQSHTHVRASCVGMGRPGSRGRRNSLQGATGAPTPHPDPHPNRSAGRPHFVQGPRQGSGAVPYGRQTRHVNLFISLTRQALETAAISTTSAAETAAHVEATSKR